MKSLDYFISEPYLMEVSSVSTSPSTAAPARPVEDEAARKAREEASQTQAGTDAQTSAPDRAAGATNEALAQSPHGSSTSTTTPNDPVKADSTSTPDPFAAAGAKDAKGLETPLKIGGQDVTVAPNGSILVGGKSINDIRDSNPKLFAEISADAKVTSQVAAAKSKAGEERTSSNPGSTDQAVKNGQATADAVTQPNGSPDGGNASTGGEKDSTTNANETAKAKEAEAQLSTEQKELKEKFDNYDPKANDGNGGTKNGGDSRALHFTDDSKNTLLDCSNKDCNPGSLVKEGERKGDYKFGQGDKATFLKGADVDAGYKASQIAKSKESAPPSNNDTPMPQPTLPEAIGAKGIETDKVKILNLNDSTNRDSGEAKNHLLDGQLNSTKNTFGTFTEGEGANAKHYMGFFSEGFGKGDERSGVVEIDANGKPKTEGNLGAGEGWKPASAEQKAMLAKAHDARASELKKLGNGDVNAGLAKLNQIQELQGRIDNLQTWAHSEANKSGANAGGIDTTKMNSLNSAMDLLNKGDLEGAKNEFGKLKSDEIAKYELGQKLTELKGQGFSDAEISKLKESNSTIADINKAIDAKRDKAHALSEADKTKFADTIKDLESRATTEQKVILDKLKGMAGKDGLDKMGKYLQTELKNLAAKVAPKPEPKKKDETRGDGDTIDFTKDAGAKAFKEDFIKSFGEGKQADGEKAFNDLFGKAESNPALKGVIEDFKSLTALDKDGKLKAGLLDALKAGDLEKIKGLQGEITKKSDEASKELADVTAKLTGANKTASEANDAAKKALEANKDEAKKAELEKAATEAKAAFDKSTKELTKLAELKKGLEPLKNLTSKYGKTEDGKLGITGADGKVTALKQDKVEVTPQDIAKNNEELKAKIANGTAKAEEVQKYLADNKIQLTYHTAAGAKNTDGSAVCTPCENNIGVAEKLAQLAGANFNKIPYDSLSKSGAVPRLEITRPGKQNQVIEGTQGTINDYLSKLI